MMSCWLLWLVFAFLSIKIKSSLTASHEPISRSAATTTTVGRYLEESSPLRNSPLKTNLLFIGPSKTGSSTTSGILRRVGAKYGLTDCNRTRMLLPEYPILPEPRYISGHHAFQFLPLPPAYEKLMKEKINYHLKLPIYYITMIRDPIERCLSQFYHFDVSRQNVTNNDTNKLLALKKCVNIQSTILTRFNLSYEYRIPVNYERVLDIYNFIGLTERYDASILLLAYDLNLTMCDILYLKAKDSKEQRPDDLRFVQAKHIPLQNESSVIREYALGKEFQSRNQHDYMLYKAVNTRMNNIIDGIGKVVFFKTLKFYKETLQYVFRKCHPRDNTKRLQDVLLCYFWDEGCGIRCLDEVCTERPKLHQRLRILLS